MKIGLFTMPYMRLPLERAFRDAARFGYDGVEIWGGRPHAYSFDLKAGGISEIKELSRRYGLPIIGYTPEMNMYPYNMMIGIRGDAPRQPRLCQDLNGYGEGDGRRLYTDLRRPCRLRGNADRSTGPA